MNLLIMSLSDAVEHNPHVPTHAIGIFSSWDGRKSNHPLINSPLYLNGNNGIYVFDGYTPPSSVTIPLPPDSVIFDRNLARQIIDDFNVNRSRAKALLAYCSNGYGRSSAVVMALNKLFGLGADESTLLRRYERMNSHIYRTLLDTGKEPVI